MRNFSQSDYNTKTMIDMDFQNFQIFRKLIVCSFEIIYLKKTYFGIYNLFLACLRLLHFIHNIQLCTCYTCVCIHTHSNTINFCIKRHIQGVKNYSSQDIGKLFIYVPIQESLDIAMSWKVSPSQSKKCHSDNIRQCPSEE